MLLLMMRVFSQIVNMIVLLTMTNDIEDDEHIDRELWSSQWALNGVDESVEYQQYCVDNYDNER